MRAASSTARSAGKSFAVVGNTSRHQGARREIRIERLTPTGANLDLKVTT
jgi:hypothetical protein